MSHGRGPMIVECYDTFQSMASTSGFSVFCLIDTLRGGDASTTVLAGTSFRTTAYGPIFTLSPMLILPITMQPVPKYTLSPIDGYPVDASVLPIVT